MLLHVEQQPGCSACQRSIASARGDEGLTPYPGAFTAVTPSRPINLKSLGSRRGLGGPLCMRMGQVHTSSCKPESDLELLTGQLPMITLMLARAAWACSSLGTSYFAARFCFARGSLEPAQPILPNPAVMSLGCCYSRAAPVRLHTRSSRQWIYCEKERQYEQGHPARGIAALPFADASSSR
jgi:hypothetical protein